MNASRKVMKTVRDWMAYKDKEEWLKDMRGNLSLVVSIIATITFQNAVNPPGGVFQASTKDDLACNIYNSKNMSLSICPGEAVLAVVFQTGYFKFLLSNTICFISSLSVCLLLVSGFPLKHRFPTWLLSVAMCFTIISLGFTYMYAVSMVTPDNIWPSTVSVFLVVFYIWITLLAIVGLVLVTRLFFWSFRIWNESRNSQ